LDPYLDLFLPQNTQKAQMYYSVLKLKKFAIFAAFALFAASYFTE